MRAALASAAKVQRTKRESLSFTPALLAATVPSYALIRAARHIVRAQSFP